MCTCWPQYVLQCHRYVERNPVRAGMVREASAYPWSSHSANALGIDDPSLTPHVEYEGLALDRQSRLVAYRGLCSAEEDQPFVKAIREATYGGFPLVGASLRAELEAKGCRVERGNDSEAGATALSATELLL